MTKMTQKPAVPRKTGMTHGVRAYIDSGKLPSGRAYRRAMKEVNKTREKLIVKYGGDKIEPDVLVMVDSAAKAMMVQELCSLYIKRYGILRQDSLNVGNLELHSVLAKSFASYGNLARLSLEAAARLADRKMQDDGPYLTIDELGAKIHKEALEIEAKTREAAEKAALGGERTPQVAQDRLSPEDSGKDTGNSDDTPEGDNSSRGREDDGGRGEDQGS